MNDAEAIFERLTAIARAFEKADLEPVLVGGLALVTLGSTRVTRDCDVALADTPEIRKRATEALFSAGCRLIARWDEKSLKPRTLIENPVVAAARVVIDDNSAAFFWAPEPGLRVDAIFRLEIFSDELIADAERIPLSGKTTILRASVEHLKKLKTLSLKADPRRIRDKQDIVFLEDLKKRTR